LSMVEFGIWQIGHSLDSYVPIFLKWAVRQSCPVWSLKFDTASFLGLPLYSANILWIPLQFFVAASSSASCLYSWLFCDSRVFFSVCQLAMVFL
jgi:hypothetical protein